MVLAGYGIQLLISKILGYDKSRKIIKAVH